MSDKDVADLKKRLLRSAQDSAQEGHRILSKEANAFLEAGAIRTAANQLRQAAKDLDQLDAVLHCEAIRRM